MEDKKGFICCLCNKKSFGWGDGLQWGNNPDPLMQNGECCDECNTKKVIPERIRLLDK